MNLPLFFTELVASVNETLVLPEESSKHIVQVLRMSSGDKILLTNGKGQLLHATVDEPHKKKTSVTIEKSDFFSQQTDKTTIAISLLKNSSRFEWFLEKATELGITEIIPLICERTERQHFRLERMKGILVSAMLQSQQWWLPEMGEPTSLRDILDIVSHQQKFIAHCDEDPDKRDLRGLVQNGSRIILIGPEGDFSPPEIELAKSKRFKPVSLGQTRLRTETAGMAAAVLLR